MSDREEATEADNELFEVCFDAHDEGEDEVAALPTTSPSPKERVHKKPTKQEILEKERKARIANLEKQKKLRSAVVKVIESLIEGPIREEILIENAFMLSKSCYEDLTTERSLTRICGYPICPKSLPTNIPKQQYKIDARNNKIYDITERKLFCSNLCFKASTFFKEQLEDQPAWLRDDHSESTKQQIKPLKLYSERKGLPGTEVKYEEASEVLNTLVSDLAKLEI